eukprot:gene7532-10262_t
MSYTNQIKSPTELSRKQSQSFGWSVGLNKMKLLSTYSRHGGCVNRITWNNNGSLMASCSDDLQVCIWDVHLGKSRSVLPTSHTSNILGVRFVEENSDNKLVVTCGMDSLVEVHTVSHDYSCKLSSEQLYCHLEAVKYIETEASEPNLFFSASEDGYVRQYDSRLPLYGCTRSSDGQNGLGSMFISANCLLRLTSGIKINSIRLNPINSNLFVVSASDSIVRVYDRRMLSLSSPSNIAENLEPYRRFCPSHLTHNSKAHTTFSEFSSCGKSVLASYHSDHTYSFNMDNIENELEISYPVLGASATMPWRSHYISAASNDERIVLANQAIEVGQAANELGLNVTSYNMFTRAIEIATYCLSSEDKNKQSALRSMKKRKFYTYDVIDSNNFKDDLIVDSNGNVTIANLSKATQMLINGLSNRSSVCERRIYAGDLEVALSDVELILQYKPHDIEHLLKRARILLGIGRPLESYKQLDELKYILNIQSKMGYGGDIGYLQNEVSTLKSKVSDTISNNQSSVPHKRVKTKKQQENFIPLTASNIVQNQHLNSVFSDGSSQYYPLTLNNMFNSMYDNNNGFHTVFESTASVRSASELSYNSNPNSTFLNNSLTNVGNKRLGILGLFNSFQASLQNTTDNETINQNENFNYLKHSKTTSAELQSGTIEVIRKNKSANDLNMVTDNDPNNRKRTRQDFLVASTSSMTNSEHHTNHSNNNHHHLNNSHNHPIPHFRSLNSNNANVENITQLQKSIQIHTLSSENDSKKNHKNSNNSNQSHHVSNKLITNFTQRFIGASNVTSDIRESVFIGADGEFVASGSDDGRLFVWDRYTGEIVFCRSSDPDLLNCIAMHPVYPVLATAGLDDCIRLWGASSLSDQFKESEKADPFRHHCGKLELPELSRLRSLRDDCDLNDNSDDNSDYSSSIGGSGITLLSGSNMDNNSESSYMPENNVKNSTIESRQNEWNSLTNLSNNVKLQSGHDQNGSSISNDHSPDHMDDYHMNDSSENASNRNGENHSSDENEMNESGMDVDVVFHISSHHQNNSNNVLLEEENHKSLKKNGSSSDKLNTIETSSQLTSSKSNGSNHEFNREETKSDSSNKKSNSSTNSDSNEDGCTSRGTGNSNTTNSNRNNESTNGDNSSDTGNGANHHIHRNSEDSSTAGSDNTTGNSNNNMVTMTRKNDNSSGNLIRKEKTNEEKSSNTIIRNNSSEKISTEQNLLPDNNKNNNIINNNSLNKNNMKSNNHINNHNKFLSWDKNTHKRNEQQDKRDQFYEGNSSNSNSNSSNHDSNSNEDSNSSKSSHQNTRMKSSEKSSLNMKNIIPSRNIIHALKKKISVSVYRKALKHAMTGQPMDADEAIALEEIVANNQKLIKFSPSNGYSREYNDNWSVSSSSLTNQAGSSEISESIT